MSNRMKFQKKKNSVDGVEQSWLSAFGLLEPRIWSRSEHCRFSKSQILAIAFLVFVAFHDSA